MPDDMEVDEGRAEATETVETFQRHGDPDPSKWEKAEAVTDRPNDTPMEDAKKPAEYAVPNSTLSSRAKVRKVDVEPDAEPTAEVVSSAKRAKKGK